MADLRLILVLGGCILSGGVAAMAQVDCMVCHEDPSIGTIRNGRAVSLSVDAGELARSVHADVECTFCHEGLSADDLPHAATIKPVDCGSCHAGESTDVYTASVHAVSEPGKRPAASCSACHGTHEIRKLSDADDSERIVLAQNMCAGCHRSIHTEFLASDHGRAFSAGVAGAPGCIECHGEHGVASPSADSAATSRSRQAKLCLSCHLDNADVRAIVGPTAGFIASYEQSVHGIASNGGNNAAATCSDCHGSHEMTKGSNPRSKVSRQNISATCGACHADIQEQYDRSIHGKSASAGILASATCTDCHGEHRILSPNDADSPVSAANVSAQVCSPCHGSVRLAEKYGLSSDRFQTYEDSYHGLAGRGGSVEAANCASCHGVHDILPSSDEHSRIHVSNLASTCGSCHPGANENFTKGKVHFDAATDDESILSLVATIYIFLIAVTIGGMFLHNLLDFIRKSREILRKRRRGTPARSVPHRLYLRMSFSERLQHGTMMVTFCILVVTGFMLKFPEAWWVVPIRAISPAMFEIRSLLHRIAGAAMILASLYHLWYVLFVPRGKELLRDLLPAWCDLTDPFRVIAFNIGMAKEKPRFGRFSYVEKAEYWALVWGTVIMGLTGILLWFENTFLGMFGKLWWDVGLIVHYYEAWLATLAIIVWHFYFVIANPDVYPMNLAWWKGTLTEEEMEAEHPLELEEIRQIEEAEAKAAGSSEQHEN